MVLASERVPTKILKNSMKRRDMILAVDVDDVTLNLVPNWIKKYNEIYDDNLQVDSITDWNIQSFVKEECGSKIYDLLTSELYETIPLVDGAKEGIEFLRSLGHGIVFVTCPVENTFGVKYHLLKKYGLISNVKEYIECCDKSRIRTDLLIDDGMDNILRFKGTAILFDRPWNKKFNWDLSVCGWGEIQEMFLALKRNFGI